MDDPTRREVVKAGGVLASGGVTALSGCTESLQDAEDGLGADGDDSSHPAFARWLYAPDVVGLGSYAYTHVDVEAVNDRSGTDVSSLPETRTISRQLLTGNIDGIEHGLSVDYTDAAATGAVAWGSLDLSDARSQVDGSVEENDSIETASHANFELYFDETNAVAFAGDDSSVLVTTAEDASPRDILEAMIDARRDSVERLAASDDAIDPMLRHQSDVAVAFGTPDPFRDDAGMFERAGDDERTIESGGYAFILDGESLRRRLIVVTDAPVEDAESFGKTLAAVDQLSDPTYAQDGRVVTVEADVGAAEDAEQQGDTPPQVTFEFEHDLDAGTVTITHAGGNPIDPSNLELVYETDDPRTLSWADRTSGQVEAGTSVRFPLTAADQGGQLLVRWSDGDREFPLSGVVIPERTDDGGDGGEVPQVSMDADFDHDSGTVTVTHAGGDTVPADELDIVFHGDEPRVIHWNDVSDQSSVSAGDTVTVELVEADYGGELMLGWRPETEALDRVKIPEP